MIAISEIWFYNDTLKVENYTNRNKNERGGGVSVHVNTYIWIAHWLKITGSYAKL